MSQNETLLKYGRLAAEYARTRDGALKAELESLERELGLPPEQIIARVLDLVQGKH